MPLTAATAFTELAEDLAEDVLALLELSGVDTPSELVAGALAGLNANDDRRAIVVAGATHFGDCPMVAGAIVVANGFKPGDPVPRPRIIVGPMTQAVRRSRYW